jgi:ferredoxin
MRRKIITIDKAKCDGCGLCVNACQEGAIELTQGKARLISDEYCDGLGNCLPECPTGAIEIVEKEATAFNEQAVQARQQSRQLTKPASPACGGGCPGSMAKLFDKKNPEMPDRANQAKEEPVPGGISQLRQWPVQLSLINPYAGYLKDADLLIAADCAAYAYGAFHQDFIKDRITMIGCPKLDDIQAYQEKLTEIFRNNEPHSITVVRMEVPCCSGIVSAVKKAMLDAQVIVPYTEVMISTDGERLS